MKYDTVRVYETRFYELIETEKRCEKLEQAFEKQIEKVNTIVNDVLDDIRKKLLLVRKDIDRYGYDDDSVRVYDAVVEIIETFRR